ncbi:hypothetical protein D3C76_361420 [compost metagenome]
MSAFLEISSFGKQWKGTTNFKVMPSGNYEFRATITYISVARGTEHEDCTVKIIRNGMNDGNIEIFENGLLQNATHHLVFKAAYQEYEFDNINGTLLVTGNSPPNGW